MSARSYRLLAVVLTVLAGCSERTLMPAPPSIPTREGVMLNDKTRLLQLPGSCDPCRWGPCSVEQRSRQCLSTCFAWLPPL